MIRRTIVFASVLAFSLFAAPKLSPTPTAKVSNMQVELTATLYADKASIQKLLGSDLGGYYVVIDAQISPRTKEKIKLVRDDFQLRSDRDGERARPFAASQVAGRGALVVSRTSEGGGVGGETGGGVLGGIGMGGIGIGNSGGSVANSAKMDAGSKSPEDTLLALLQEKVLHEGEFDKPVSGLLIFQMEPKQKIKDLELTYTGPGSRLMLRFR